MHLFLRAMSTRNREQENLNGEHTHSRLGESLTHRIARKLGDIHQSLALPVEGGQALEFLTNTQNIQRINDLVEDVHEVLMEYQVCVKLLILYHI